MDKIFNFPIQDLHCDFSSPSFDQLRKGNLLRIYIKELVVNEITKNISIEKKQLENAKSNFYKEKNIRDSSQLNEFLLFNGINEKDLDYQLSLPLKIKKLSKNVLEVKIENHFLKRKDELDLYKYNAIRVKESDLAHEIYFQLENGESNFFELSRKYSLDKKIFPEGIVGPKNSVGLNPVIREKLRNYDIGNLIKPFQIDNWWLIIKLFERERQVLIKRLLSKWHLNYAKFLSMIKLTS